MNKRLLFFLIAAVFLSCSKKEETPAVDLFLGYKVTSVTNGGSVTGKVTNADSVPFAEKISIQRDQAVCGESHLNPSSPGTGSGVQGSIVWLEGIREGKEFAFEKSPKLEQRGCQFLPHVQIVAPGTTMLITNDDAVLHNYHVTTAGTTVTNEAQPEGSPAHEMTLKRPGLHQVVCDVHPWMKGFIMVAEHPYYAVTDQDGRFTLSDVPPGAYKLRIWRDDWHIEELKNAEGRIVSYKWKPDLAQEMSVTVEAGKQVEVNFALSEP